MRSRRRVAFLRDMSRVLGTTVAGISLAAAPAGAQGVVRLEPETVEEFDAYVVDAEVVMSERIDGERNFLWADDVPGRRAALREGQILIETVPDVPDVSGGLLHVWPGAVFIPAATGAAVLGVLEDYDRHQEWYPEVTRSELLGDEGGVLKGFQQLRKTKVLTVVLNTEHEAR